MSKVFTLLFAVVYLLLSAGFNVNVHRCGKKIKVVSIDSPHEKKCPCGKKMRPGCCKDISAYFKITDTQNASSKVVLQYNNSVKAIAVFVLSQHEKVCSQVEIFDIANYHAPPFKIKLPVYLADRVLRI